MADGLVYREESGFRERWRGAARAVFSPRAAVDHYRGLAKQMIYGKLEAETVRAKDYLYALRALLAACWVADGKGIPPVPFSELVPLAPAEVMAEIPGLLEHKARTGESKRMERIPEIDGFLQSCLSEIAAKVPCLPQGPGLGDVLDRLLRAEIRRPRIAMMQPEDFTLDRVRQPDLLLFDTVAGSHAYGTAIAGSDEDRRGVFVAPADFLLGLDRIEQVADAWMHCNQDAFQAHCKAHREYWEWVAQRNDERYQTNAQHGRGYDSKNLMHTLRLLDMAGDIATEGVLHVRRSNRDYLLRVRAGEFEYEALVGQAEEKLACVREAFQRSNLPDQPVRERVIEVLAGIRHEF